MSAPEARADVVKYVDGDRYEMRQDRWFFIDQVGEAWEVSPGRIAVRFSGHVESIPDDLVLDADTLEAERSRPSVRGHYRFRFDRHLDPVAILESILSDPRVDEAYVNTRVKFFGDPDPYYSNQWNLTQMRVDRAWRITSGSPAMSIAVLDAGFEIDHEDFAGGIWTNEIEASGNPLEDDDGNGFVDDINGWDFRDNDNNPAPGVQKDEHGTAVAGIAVAARDNGLGIAGVAGGDTRGRPKLVPIRVNTLIDVEDAVEYCWRQGFDIVNMSFGTNDPGGNTAALLDSASASGAALFAATGNSGQPFLTVTFPAKHPAVVAVGSSDHNDVRVCSSTYGEGIDVVAPSASATCGYEIPYIWTTDNYASFHNYNPGYTGCGNCVAIPAENDRYFGHFDGTSAACPAAAGVACLLMSHRPGLTNVQVRQRLRDSAVDIGAPGFDIETGYGRVDAYRALTEWGTITGNVTWNGSDTHDGARYVSGDLTIAPGATLTIMPGTVVRIAAEDDLGTGRDAARIEINVQGRLNVAGSAGNPVVFESWDRLSSVDWAGIYFDSNSKGGVFKQCVIKHADTAIESYDSIQVRTTTIDSCAYAGIALHGGVSLIKDSEICRTGSYGVFIAAGAATIRATTIDSAAVAGVHVGSGAAVTARGVTVQGCETGVYVGTSAVSSVDSCVVSGNDLGIHAYGTGSNFWVKHTTVESNENNGIFCDGASHPTIDQNTIRFNGAGLYCANYSSPPVTSNVILSNGTGVAAASDADPDLGHCCGSGNNTISSHSGYYVVNFNTFTISAQNNCWQLSSIQPCTPHPSRILGSVDREAPICCAGEGLGQVEAAELPPSPSYRTRLLAAVPNPFNPTTIVRYEIAAPGGNVRIAVYDVHGALVRDLVREKRAAGQHDVVWDGTGEGGQGVASGIYFVRMTFGAEAQSMKVVMLK